MENYIKKYNLLGVRAAILHKFDSTPPPLPPPLVSLDASRGIAASVKERTTHIIFCIQFFIQNNMHLKFQLFFSVHSWLPDENLKIWSHSSLETWSYAFCNSNLNLTLFMCSIYKNYAFIS